MGRLINLYNKIKALDTDKICVDVIVENKDELLALNKEQLLEGKNNEGGDMPSYLNDPYFKSLKSAQAYSDWKDEITPNPKRKKGVMNLFIVGTYHDSIELTIEGLKINYQASFLGPEIESKHPNIYGLGPEKRIEYKEKFTLPVFKKKMEKATGLKFKK